MISMLLLIISLIQGLMFGLLTLDTRLTNKGKLIAVFLNAAMVGTITGAAVQIYG
jgi:hypothetical protein